MKKVIKNWSFLLASDVIQQLSGFFVLILLARKLSPAGYGEFNVVISLAMIFSVVANLGMSQVLIREITLAKEQGRDIISMVVPARLTSLALSVMLLLVYYHFFSHGESSHLLIFVVVTILNLSLWDISESVAFGNKVTKYSSVLNIGFSMSWLIAIYILPETFFNLTAILLVFCTLNFIKSSRYLWIVTKKYLVKQQATTELTAVKTKNIVEMSIPYLWLMAIFTISNQIPVQLLNANSDISEVGFYSVGNKLMVPIVVSISTAFKAIFPFMTEIYKSNKEEFGRYVKEGFSFIISIGTLIALVLSLSSRYWISYIFGPEYEPAIVVFNFLIWFGIISIIDSLLSMALSSSYRQNILAILATVDFLVFLPLFYIGSFHGADGISSMKLIAGVIILTYHWVVFVKVLKVNISISEVAVLYSFLFLAMTACLFVEDSWSRLLVCILVVMCFSVVRNSPVRLSMLKTLKVMRLQIRELRGVH